jgi:hypothetical protein
VRSLVMSLLIAFAVLLAASSSWAGVPCDGASDVWAAADSVHYETWVAVYVIVRDCYGDPLANRPCTFYTDHPGDMFAGNPTVTDSSGFAQAQMTSPCGPAGEQSRLYCSSQGVALGVFVITWTCTAGLPDIFGTPGDFSLCESSPNPFGQTAQIRYGVPRQASLALEIYDVFGRRVKTLVDWSVEPGVHTAVWDGTDEMGSPVASGIYYAHMTAPGFSKTTKVILLQ